MASGAWRPTQYRWIISEPFDGAEDLARRLGTAPLVAQLLHNRGLSDETACREFLDPKLTHLHDPTLLSGAQPAAARLARALADGEAIVLYGDYDVDGMTGVAILDSVLRMLGAAKVDYYVPHRLEEGYGVNVEAVRKLIADGAKLIVTVDCGIGAVEPLAEAAAAGVDVIVTDHHGPGEELPPAVAIVHPDLPGQAYPNPHLAGAGVAFKLAWQLAREVRGERRVDDRMRDFLVEATCLAALGTIADVVPLVGENRSLAVHGLRGLPATRHVGLRALIDSAGLTGEKLDAYHVGFVLAPRLNACGRMGHARLAVELLTGAGGPKSAEIAQYLHRQNAERQKVERAIAAQAAEMVESGGLADERHRAIVLACADWHGGVIGIVASRMVERFGRPAILIATNGEGGQGSGRSIPGFDLRAALSACGEHLRSCGGHAMAGGLKIDPDKIPDFTAAFLEYAAGAIRPEQLMPALRIDVEATLPGLAYHVVERLERMAPFGQGNPAPLVLCRKCRVLTPPKRIGRTGETVSMVLQQNGTSMRAVGFRMGDLADLCAGVTFVDVVGRPTLNTFQGRTSVEMQLRDVAWE